MTNYHNPFNSKPETPRTLSQNAALHVLYSIVARALVGAGYDVKTTLQNINIPMPWTEMLVKELLWRPIQIQMLGKTSTTKLTTKEIDIVWQPLKEALHKIGFTDIHFPSVHDIMMRNFNPDEYNF